MKGGKSFDFLGAETFKNLFSVLKLYQAMLVACGIFNLAELQNVELQGDSKWWNGNGKRKRHYTVRSANLTPAYWEIFKVMFRHQKGYRFRQLFCNILRLYCPA
jgi:hypothetical protein